VHCGKSQGACPFKREKSQEQGFVHEINEMLAWDNFSAAHGIILGQDAGTSGILGGENEISGECRITQGHVQSLRTNGRHDMGGLADQYHAIPCELPGGESFHGE